MSIFRDHFTPDLYLAAEDDEPVRLLLNGGWPSAQALLARTPDSDWAPLPPFDVAQQLPVGEYTPRASATASITVTDSPVGDFEFHDVFVDGQLSARIGGPSPTPPDMTITISFAAMTSPPSTSVLEMIENAQMNSPTTNALMLVAGLYDCPSVREAMGGARRSVNYLLAQLAFHRSAPSFRECLKHELR